MMVEASVIITNRIHPYVGIIAAGVDTHFVGCPFFLAETVVSHKSVKSA